MRYLLVALVLLAGPLRAAPLDLRLRPVPPRPAYADARRTVQTAGGVAMLAGFPVVLISIATFLTPDASRKTAGIELAAGLGLIVGGFATALAATPRCFTP